MVFERLAHATAPSERVLLPSSAAGKPDYSQLNLSSKQFWGLTSEQREGVFSRLRAQEPVSWQPPVEEAVAPDPNDPGYWAVVRHADIVRVSRDHRTFISGQGVQFDLLPPEALEMSQSFLAMDPPRHAQLRKLVSAAFTPRQIHKLEEQIKLAAREVVDEFTTDPFGEIDFVDRCATPLPARLFCDMFGIPAALRATVHEAVGDLMAWADPEALSGRTPTELLLRANATLHEVAAELIALRRRAPGDDLLTNLVNAELAGHRLTDMEIGSFFVLMSVAGTDTTKHTASWTAKALSDFPEQRAWLRADYPGRINTAVEEFIRYASPVMTFRRTAVTETVLGGKRILPGDKVVMFYPSGNRDPEVFAAPESFDLSRNPNPHVGFGGGGIHYCLGSFLAKTTLRELFGQLLTRIPHFTVGKPDALGTNFMRGVKRLPFRFVPEGAEAGLQAEMDLRLTASGPDAGA